jgi:hypothetical protein
MKIRNGFVSNSSSSSFLIFGKSFDSVEDLNLTEEQKEEFEIDLDSYSLMEKIIPWNKKLNIEWHIMDYDDIIYIGQSWDQVRDDETGLQFKERTVKEINDLLGTDFTVENLQTIQESWYG